MKYGKHYKALLCKLIVTGPNISPEYADIEVEDLALGHIMVIGSRV